MSSNGKGSSSSKGNKAELNSQQGDVRLGDGVLNAGTVKANEILKNLLELAMQKVGDYAAQEIKDISIEDAISKVMALFQKKEIKAEIVASWSAHLYEQGIVPEGYVGLSDEMIKDNFVQEGYLMGCRAGFYATVMALADNGVPKELAVPVRDDIYPIIGGHYYKNFSKDFRDKCHDEKYRWLLRAKASKEIKFKSVDPSDLL